MSGFLDQMAQSSAERVARALQEESSTALERRARSSTPSPALRLSPLGFDVIAEIKLRSPAAGVLGSSGQDWLGRAAAYARGGAVAVSVLTEPSRFDGSLDHLRQAAQVLEPLGVPVMRKDFIVDPYQVLEARVAGAGGVLLILRMLSRPQIIELLEVAATFKMFVLLEAFDADDLALARNVLESGAPRGQTLLVGVNCRDLQTLKVLPQKFEDLVAQLPAPWPAVAESGVGTPAAARNMRRLGYRLALIGTALMVCENPELFIAEILRTARTVQS